jgi:hypothetical protein
MPEIPVSCEISGFEPHVTPIHWKIELMYRVSRFCRSDDAALSARYCPSTDSHCPKFGNGRHKHINHAYYHPTEFTFSRTYQGTARSKTFTIFRPTSEPPTGYAADTDVSYDQPWHPYDVFGGHGILSVWVDVDGVRSLDYVHLWINGGGGLERRNGNPSIAQVERHLKVLLGFPNPDIASTDPSVSVVRRELFAIAMAAFDHESNGFHAFDLSGSKASQGKREVSLRFNLEKLGWGCANQPKCSVLYSYPVDPIGNPLVTPDFGVGITQTTIFGASGGTGPKAELFWNWKYNMEAGLHVLLAKAPKALDGMLPGRKRVSRALNEVRKARARADAAKTQLEQATSAAQGKVTAGLLRSKTRFRQAEDARLLSETELENATHELSTQTAGRSFFDLAIWLWTRYNGAPMSSQDRTRHHSQSDSHFPNKYTADIVGRSSGFGRAVSGDHLPNDIGDQIRQIDATVPKYPYGS